MRCANETILRVNLQFLQHHALRTSSFAYDVRSPNPAIFIQVWNCCTWLIVNTKKSL